MAEKHHKKLSVIIITKNEQDEIVDCISSVLFADEILVIDSNSRDNTNELAKRTGAIVYSVPFKNFSHQRNVGLQHTTGTWVLYLDADERIPKGLAEEIQLAIQQETYTAYKIPRKNTYFRHFESPSIEYMERLFLRSALKGWHGDIHESPILLSPSIGILTNPILHSTHKDIESMVQKTNEWSEIEANLLVNAHHPKMEAWRFLRVMLTKFIESYIAKGAWKMGTTGIIESLFQSYSYFITYAKLWEQQQRNKKVNK